MAYRANLFDFGAIAGSAGGTNAATNDAALAAAIASPTRYIEIEPGIFEFSQRINLNVHGKHLIGTDGNGVFAPSYATIFEWWGADDATGVLIWSGTSGVDLVAPELSNVMVDGKGLLKRGIASKATQHQKMYNVTVKNTRGANGICYHFQKNVGGANGSIGAVLGGDFRNLDGFAPQSGIALLVDGAFGCKFENINMIHNDGVGIYLRDADDLHFFVACTARGVDKTGISVILDGAGATPVLGNIFWGLHCGAHPAGIATRIYSSGTLARQNVIYGLGGVDNAPTVEIVGGSELYYQYHGGGYTPTLEAEKALYRMPKRQELVW